MAELQYRPNHYDDWGMIRNADGSMHASVHRPETYGGEFDECREEGTDPFADLARKIIFYDDLEAENASLRQLLSEAEAALDEREIASGLTSNGNLWRFWAEIAKDMAVKLSNAEKREREARGKALEKAANMADEMPLLRPISTAHVKTNTPKDVAAAIRALQSEER